MKVINKGVSAYVPVAVAMRYQNSLHPCPTPPRYVNPCPTYNTCRPCTKPNMVTAYAVPNV